MNWAKVEMQRVSWHRLHQKVLRGDLYQGLQDAVSSGNHDPQPSIHFDPLDILHDCSRGDLRGTSRKGPAFFLVCANKDEAFLSPICILMYIYWLMPLTSWSTHHS